MVKNPTYIWFQYGTQMVKCHRLYGGGLKFSHLGHPIPFQ